MPSNDIQIFFQTLLTSLDRLKTLSGKNWPIFKKQLQEILSELVITEEYDHLLFLSDKFIETGLQSAAGDLFQSLFTHAVEQADNETATTVPDIIQDARMLLEALHFTETDPFVPVSYHSADDIMWVVKFRNGCIKKFKIPDPKNLENAPPVRDLHKNRVRMSGTVDPETDVAERYMNVYFTDLKNRLPIPSTNPLVLGKTYGFAVDISPERTGLGQDATAFPDKVLDDCWQDLLEIPLTIWAASRDFNICPEVQFLALPRQGPSKQVHFSIRPQLEKGWGYIQVGVYYKGHLLQSKQVEACIVLEGAEREPSLKPLQTARLTFSTTTHIDPVALAHLPERFLSIDIVQDPRDSSLDFLFLDRTHGQTLAHYDTHLQASTLGSIIGDLRNILKQMVTGRKGPAEDNGYAWILKGNLSLLNAWLPRLASAGRNFYRAVLPRERGQGPDEDQGERLRAALQPDTIIQINPVLGEVTLPWALLYERKIKYIEGRTRVCEMFTSCVADPGVCSCSEDAYLVCPYAFWGYRYSIEQLPCWVTGDLMLPVLVRQIENKRPLVLNLNVWRKFSLWRDHLIRLKNSGEVEILVAEEISELEDIWQKHPGDLDVIYFYSHGGLDPKRGPLLTLSDAAIDSNFIDASELNLPHRPLVFLNGCATGHYSPKSYMSLIKDFRQAGASGLIGTECKVSELFAESYAASIFPLFFKGERLGQVMLDVRRKFLREQLNPLGLVYTLYAAHDIALSLPVPGN